MTHWEERIHRHSDPAIVSEHVLRYRFAQPLIVDADVWADLGCGNGIAAGVALGDARPRAIVLADVGEGVAQGAAEHLGGDAAPLTGDLSDPGVLVRVGEALAERRRGGPSCVTAFEVVEHLPRFAVFVDFLVAQSEEHGTDVVLSVPNDAFWAIENPFHETAWGAGAFDELRRVLPAGHRVASQAPLEGSVLRPAEGDLPVDVAVTGRLTAPSHFVVAFGPRAHALGAVADVHVADLAERRRWERQRDADVDYLRADVEHFKRLAGA